MGKWFWPEAEGTKVYLGPLHARHLAHAVLSFSLGPGPGREALSVLPWLGLGACYWVPQFRASLCFVVTPILGKRPYGPGPWLPHLRNRAATDSLEEHKPGHWCACCHGRNWAAWAVVREDELRLGKGESGSPRARSVAMPRSECQVIKLLRKTPWTQMKESHAEHVMAHWSPQHSGG